MRLFNIKKHCGSDAKWPLLGGCLNSKVLCHKMGLHRRVKLCMYSSPLHAVIPRTCQALLWVATMGLHPQSRQTLTFVPDSWTADLFSGTLGTPRNACTPSHRRQNILSEPKRSRFRRFGRGKGGKPINIAGWPASRRRRNRLFPVIRP